MKKIIVMAVGAVSALGAAAAIFVVLSGASGKGASRHFMMGTDFGAIRREALGLHPIGSQIAAVAQTMTDLGFRCYNRIQVLDNITAPSVVCDSNGRGEFTSSRISVVLIARNGALTDVAVSDGFDPLEASAKTPDPNPGGHLPGPIPRYDARDPEWDEILAAAAKPRAARSAAALSMRRSVGS